jgi:glutaredoxin
MKRMVLLLACLAALPSITRAGELYRWVDSLGKVYYGDVLPLNALQVEVKKFPKDTSSNEYLPYETLRAQQNFPVTLYVGESCGDLCVQARNLLNKRGVPFSEKLLKANKDIEAFRQLSGFDAFVPTLAVGKDFLKGFVESQWNSELDIAGYPKTASYRQRTATPSTPSVPETPSDEGQTTPPTEQ